MTSRFLTLPLAAAALLAQAGPALADRPEAGNWRITVSTEHVEGGKTRRSRDSVTRCAHPDEGINQDGISQLSDERCKVTFKRSSVQDYARSICDYGDYEEEIEWRFVGREDDYERSYSKTQRRGQVVTIERRNEVGRRLGVCDD